MENRSHALWAGFFTVAMLCATVFAGIWLNRDKTQRTAYQIVTRHAVSGLNPQAAVRYKGLTVGRVDKIEFDDSDPGSILLNVSIDPETPVTQTTFATLGYQGVTGIAYVELDDEGSKQTRIVVTEGKIPRIPLRPGLLEQLEQNSTKILASAELVSDRLAHMFAPENQKIILGAFSSTTEATAHWSKVADDLGPTIQALPGLLAQTRQTLASVQDLSQNASGLTLQLTGLARELQDPKGALNHTLTTFGALGDTIQSDTLPGLQTVSNETGESMKSFNQTMQELKDHPQSLLFGRPVPAPGPGEAGYSAPGK